MSKGVITILDRMNGAEDSILTGTGMLIDRLNKIYRNKVLAGEENPAPSPRDIFASHFIYCVAEYRPHVAIAYEYLKVMSKGINALSNGNSNKIKFDMMPNNGHFLYDQVIHVTIDEITDPAVRFRYCNFPGVRLLQNVAMVVEQVTVDQYSNMSTMLAVNLDVDQENFSTFATSVGQQTVKSGSYYNSDVAITQYFGFSDGAQTPQTTQATLDLWIPLGFWYNTDIGNALHNGLLSTLDRYIEVELTNLNNIIQACDVNGNPIAGYFDNRRLTLRNMELYSRNIYVNPEVYDLFSKRRQVSLIRVHREQVQQLNKAQDSILFSQMKYPIEHISFGFQPDINQGTMDAWYKFAALNRIPFPIPAVVNNPLLIPVQQLVVRTATYNSYSPAVTNLGLTIYGNDLYKLMPERFFNSYMGFTIPDCNGIVDVGVYQIPFSHFRRAQFVNGYLNNSTTREIFLHYNSNFISTSNQTSFYAVSRCINFLIYENGKMRLRYAT